MSESIWTEPRRKLALASCHKWHGTPHVNRVAVIGTGIDCVKFLNEILCDAEIVERSDFGGYDVQAGMHAPSSRLYNAVTKALACRLVSLDAPRFGDIAIGKTGTESAHIGFVTDGEIWHSLAAHGVTRSDWKLWRHRVEYLLRLTQTGWLNHPQTVTKL